MAITAATYFGSQGVAVDTGKLYIRSGTTDTAVLSTGAELNKLSGVTSTASELNILTGVTATASEINQHCDESANVEVVTTTNVILAAESGKTFFLNSATGFVSTLPAVAAGLRFTFILSAAVTTTGGHTVVPASGTTIKGHVLTNDVNSATDSDFGTTGEGTLTFVINKAVAGDRATFISDGTNWFAEGACSVFDAITIS